MSKEMLFWILYLIGVILWFYGDYVAGQPYPLRRVPGGLLTFLLIGLLGWRVFGAAVR